MSPVLEIIVQILWVALALWFLRGAYSANRRAEPLSLENLFPREHASNARRDVFFAMGFVIGIALLIFLDTNFLLAGLSVALNGGEQSIISN